MCTHAVKAPTKTSKCHSEEENNLTKKTMGYFDSMSYNYTSIIRIRLPRLT